MHRDETDGETLKDEWIAILVMLAIITGIIILMNIIEGNWKVNP